MNTYTKGCMTIIGLILLVGCGAVAFASGRYDWAALTGMGALALGACCLWTCTTARW